MTKYGGDPTTYQLRDMQRRLTSLEKAAIRKDVRIRNLQSSAASATLALKVVRASLIHLEEIVVALK